VETIVMLFSKHNYSTTLRKIFNYHQLEKEIKMEKLTPYSFNSAKVQISEATIIPPIYIVTVEGETGSLNPIIELIDTQKIEKGYIVIDLEGKNGLAIGSVQYKKTINVQKIEDTKGIIIKGSNKEEILDWQNASELADSVPTGLFLLPLQSSSALLGAPTVSLQLGIDTVHETVSGIATVHQSIERGTVCTSEVKGNFIYEYVMNPTDSKIRIDLTGYPHIQWPSHGGVGPVILPNFKAQIILDKRWSSGTIKYQYASSNGWITEEQNIQHQIASVISAQMVNKLSAVS